MKRINAVPIGDVLRDFFKENPQLRQKILEVRIQRAWGDIFDKLDAERVEQIVELVSGEPFGQIFMTDTNRKYLDRILTAVNQDYTLYKVEKGEVDVIELRAKS